MQGQVFRHRGAPVGDRSYRRGAGHLRDSASASGLDENAIEAVKWKFRPGYRNGKPVAVQATIVVNFRL